MAFIRRRDVQTLLPELTCPAQLSNLNAQSHKLSLSMQVLHVRGGVLTLQQRRWPSASF